MDQNNENNFTTEVPKENNFSTDDTPVADEAPATEAINNAVETVVPESETVATAVKSEVIATATEGEVSAPVEEAPFYDAVPEQTDYNSYNYGAEATTQTAGYVSSEIPTSSYGEVPQQVAGYTSGQIPTSGYSYDNNTYVPVANNTGYDYNQYNYAYAEPVQQNATNGPALASLICGIVGFLLNPLYLVSVAAIITGIVGIAGANGRPKGMGIAGLILGIVSLFVQVTLDLILSIATLGVCSCSALI